jgi:hypothetical protein
MPGDPQVAKRQRRLGLDRRSKIRWVNFAEQARLVTWAWAADGQGSLTFARSIPLRWPSAAPGRRVLKPPCARPRKKPGSSACDLAAADTLVNHSRLSKTCWIWNRIAM